MRITYSIFHIKRLLKKKALEYYYKNKEKIKERERNRYNSLSPEEEKNDKNIEKNGLINYQLKGNKN